MSRPVGPAWTTAESIALGQHGDIDTQPGSLDQSATRPVQSSSIVDWDRQN